MLGANLSDQIPGGPNLTLTLTLNSNYEFSGIKPDTDIVPKIFRAHDLTSDLHLLDRRRS